MGQAKGGGWYGGEMACTSNQCFCQCPLLDALAVKCITLYTIDMSDEEIPNVYVKVASEPWVMEKLMDTENRIEKAFHEQTKYFSQQQSTIEKAFHEQTQYLAQQQALANDKLDQTVRWMIGLMISMIVALVAAIFLQPHI